MKCEICGAYNKPEYIKCIRCGNPLLSAEEEKKQEKILIEHHSPLKNTPTFREALIIEEKSEEKVEKDVKPGTHKDVPDEVDLWTGTGKKKSFFNRKKNHVPVLSIKDESTKEPESEKKEESSRTRRFERPPTGSNLEKLSKIREGQEVEVLLPPEERIKPKKQKSNRKRRFKWGRLILVSTTAGIIIIAIIVGFFYLFRGIFSDVGNLFAGHEELPNGGQPLVERIMINGQIWHQITFYGEDGERVLVENPIRSLSIQDNRVVLLLDDSSFIPEEDTQDESLEYVLVDLDASLFSKDGDETPLDVPPYNIPVPPSPLKIVYPTEPNIKVDYTQVLVKVKVTPGSRVLIDDINLTDVVDTDGFVQKYVNLSEGINEIVIQVETYKHRKTIETITVNRPELDVAIELDQPPSVHYEDEVWIYGTVEQDAEIYVDTYRTAAKVSYPELVEVEDENGNTVTLKKFQFRYVLSAFGWNDIEITATAADGRSATLIHRVERIPDHRSYTRSAWPMDYPYLAGSTEALIGQVFQCKGEVIRREDTDTSRMYLFDTGLAGTRELIMIEYTGNQEFELGQKYIVYADVVGIYQNYPLLAGRFIYDWELEEYNAAVAEAIAAQEAAAQATATPIP